MSGTAPPPHIMQPGAWWVEKICRNSGSRGGVEVVKGKTASLRVLCSSCLSFLEAR
jgi:hypothetical protein